MQEPEQLRIFNEWLDLHQRFLIKVARAYSRNADDWEDLFQEIAVEVWKSVPTFRGESSEGTWLYRIAFRTAMSWSKRQRRQDGIKDSLEEIVQEPSATPNPPDPRVAWLYEQITALNEVDRSVALLLLEDHRYAEIGAILGLTESNVGAKVHRIKKELIRKSAQFSTEVSHGL